MARVRVNTCTRILEIRVWGYYVLHESDITTSPIMSMSACSVRRFDVHKCRLACNSTRKGVKVIEHSFYRAVCAGRRVLKAQDGGSPAASIEWYVGTYWTTVSRPHAPRLRSAVCDS